MTKGGMVARSSRTGAKEVRRPRRATVSGSETLRFWFVRESAA